MAVPIFRPRPPPRPRTPRFPSTTAPVAFTYDPRGLIQVAGSAPVEVTLGGGQVAAGVTVEWDFDNDGDFDEPVEDITSRVLSASTVAGRDYPSQLHGRAAPGRMRLVVDNTDDWFQPFSSTSPLTTGGNSLDPGRRIRIRDASIPVPRPVVLAADTFQGEGALGNDELGNPWVLQAGAGPTRNNGQLDFSPTVDSTVTLDVGVAEYYVQATMSVIRPQTLRIVYGFIDFDNFEILRWDGGTLIHFVKTAGVFGAGTIVNQTEDNQIPFTIGVEVGGGTATFYQSGQVVNSLATTHAGTSVGLLSRPGGQGVFPVADEFYAWDVLAADPVGPLWGGQVERVTPSINRRQEKIATIDCAGPLAKLANTEATPPDTVGVSTVSEGITTSQAIGSILQQAASLHPPVEDGLSAAALTMGGATIDRQFGLPMARKVEQVEAGFLHETRDGDVIFDARNDRAGTTAESGWSDSATQQFRFETVEVLDSRREVVNEVRAEVSPRIPSIGGAGFVAGSSAAGVQRIVDAVPDSNGGLDTGGLFIAVFISTVHTTGEFWLIPPGFVALTDRGDELGRIRVYAKILDDSDDGSSIPVYADDSSAGGAFIRYQATVKNWYGAIEDGVAVTTRAVGLPNQQTEAQGGTHNFTTMIPPWGRSSPTLFVSGRTGAVSSNGGLQVNAATLEDLPAGYNNPTSSQQPGAVDAFDVAAELGLYDEITNVHQPTPFTTEFNGFDYLDTFTIAVRGFAGTSPSGLRGETITARDVDSIRRIGTINTHPTPGRMFKDTEQAEEYGAHILTKHAVERPLLRASFTATKRDGYRDQALNRRVGDKIYVDLTGKSGVAADGEFFIESIAHEFAEGETLWRTTWTLSPA